VEYTMTALPILSPRSHEGVVADNNLTNNPNGAELWIEDANEATTAYVPNEGDVIDEWRGNGEATTQADQEAYPYYYDEGTGQYYFDYNASATTNDGGGDVPPSETLGSSHVEEYVMADLPTTTSPNGPSSDVINGATGDEATTFEATTSIFSGDKHEMGQVIASTTTHGKKKVVLATPRDSLESDDANDESQRDISSQDDAPSQHDKAIDDDGASNDYLVANLPPLAL
ncbi:hypothetical protein As57867_004151, partial [Aphanomyces stellatus]